MNNNMYLYFDSNGYLKEFITCPARAGSENVNSIYFYVEPALESDRDKVDGNGDAYYALPNNVHHGTLDFKLPEVIQGVTDADGNLLIPLTFTSSNYVITDIQPFDKKRDLLFFKWFQKYQFVKVDLTANILLNAGNVLCTIGCYNSANTKVYNLDLFSFYVADNAVLRAVYITTSQYHELLTMFDEAKSMFDIEKRIVVLDDISVPNVIDGYEDDQLIYDKATALYYVVNSSSEDGYEPANNNGLLGNKGALIRFFDLTETITLQEIYDLIGANRYASLNVDGIEYLVIMSNNNSIKAYDLLEKKLYDYIDAPNDMFASVLNNIPTTFVEHRNEGSKVYGTNASAQDTTISYSALVVNNGIVQRGGNGQINVPTTPVYAYNAASKDYIDRNYGKKVQLTIDNDTFVLTIKLLNNNDSVISQANVDLPLESIVVSAQYYDTYTYQGVTYTKVLVIVLATTDNPIIAPVGDLVSGLVSETTFNNAVAQLQTNINKCVQQTNIASVVYGTNGSGSQRTIKYGTSVSANGLVQRDALGQINVSATPSSNSNATSKQYVDTFGRTLEFSIDNSTYVMTFKLKDNNGNIISTQTIDLPLETMVVDGRYDDTTESLVLELKNGQTISIPISDLISGLVSETSLANTLQSYYTKAQIDQMVAGFVFADVDDYLSDSSTNPVENRVITNALEQKANVDGNYPTMTVGLAKNLDTKLEQNDDSAYLFRTAGGSLEIGDFCKEKAIVGGSLGFNQVVRDGNFPSLAYWGYNTGIQASVSNNVLTFTASGRYQSVNQGIINVLVANHKYLLTADIKTTTATTEVVLQATPISTQLRKTLFTKSQTTWQTLCSIITWGDPQNTGLTIQIQDNRSSDWDAVQARNVMCIDLTAMFGSTIADYIYSLEQATAGAGVAWFKRYFNKPYYPYTAIGGFINVKTSGKKVVGFNQWDEEWEVGNIIWSTGENTTGSSNRIRSKNYTPVLPNTVYCITRGAVECDLFFYDANKNFISPSYLSVSTKTFTTPINCAYVRFILYGTYGTTYNNDICLNFHYDGERDGEYEPYEEQTYPNDNIELIGIPKIDSKGNLYFEGNRYNADGSVENNFGIVDLGTLNWERAQWSGKNYHFNSQGIIGLVNTSRVNISCARFVAVGQTHVIEIGNVDNVITIRTGSSTLSGLIEIRCDTYETAAAFKQAMSGVYLVYELATPTEGNATPFAETQRVDNWGTEERIDNREIPVPVGHETEYLTDLKSKLEILPNLPHNDGTYVVNVASGVGEYAPLGTWLSDNGYAKADTLPTKDSVGGTLRQCLCVKESLDFDNTFVIDLSTLTWTYDSSLKQFYSNSLNLGQPTETGKVLCTKYQVGAGNGTQNTSPHTRGILSNRVYIIDLDYTDATTFYNAMKGVLLACEKAEE